MSCMWQHATSTAGLHAPSELTPLPGMCFTPRTNQVLHIPPFLTFRVFTSRYGRMMSLLGVVPNGHALDLPNAAYGCLFYICAFFHDDLVFLPRTVRAGLMLFASCLAAASSVWLGYVLYFILHDACIVCISTYVLNTILLFASINGVFAACFPPDTGKKDQ